MAVDSPMQASVALAEAVGLVRESAPPVRKSHTAVFRRTA